MSQESLSINLMKDEALVLFEFLSRFSETDKLSIEHQSEERALWNLAYIFEKELSEPFDKKYGDILSQARERLKDNDE